MGSWWDSPSWGFEKLQKVEPERETLGDGTAQEYQLWVLARGALQYLDQFIWATQESGT